MAQEIDLRMMERRTPLNCNLDLGFAGDYVKDYTGQNTFTQTGGPPTITDNYFETQSNSYITQTSATNQGIAINVGGTRKALSFAWWQNINNGANGQTFLYPDSVTAGYTMGYRLSVGVNYVHTFVGYKTNGTYLIATNNAYGTNGLWYHVCWVYPAVYSTGLKLYIDGNLIQTTAESNINCKTHSGIFKLFGYCQNGQKFSNFRVFQNTELTLNQIKELYEQGRT